MDTFPDLGSLSDQELKDLIQQLTDEEHEVSYRRRILHGKIDILRAELVNRLRKKREGGEDVITGADVERLTDILAGQVPRRRRRVARARAAWPSTARVRLRQRGGRQLLPEVRRVPGRAAEAPWRRERRRRTPSTSDRRAQARRRRRRSRRPAPRWSSAPAAAASGQSFPLDGERMTIGRRPDADVFLDDVTVSRDHAVLVRRAGDVLPRRLRIAQRHLRQPPPHRVAPARRRRRAADRQVQADLPRALSDRMPRPRRPAGRAPATTPRPRPARASRARSR